MAKEKLSINTPIGTLCWMHITGEGVDNYNKDGKEYSGSIILDKETGDKLKATMLAFWVEHRPASHKANAEPDNLLIRDEMIKNEDGSKTSTGKVVFTARTKTTWPSGDKVKITLKGKKNNEISIGNKQIGNGSVGRIAADISIYINGRKAGISLFLKGIQLLKLIEYTGGADFGTDEDLSEYEDNINEDSADFETVTNEPAAAPQL